GDKGTAGGVPGNGNRGGNRLRAGVHRAGQHFGEVVPGPARHGHRHGDHGLRRGGGGGQQAGRILRGSIRRREYDVYFWRSVPGGDADRRRHTAPSSGGLETGRLDRAGQGQQD